MNERCLHGSGGTIWYGGRRGARAKGRGVSLQFTRPCSLPMQPPQELISSAPFANTRNHPALPPITPPPPITTHTPTPPPKANMELTVITPTCTVEDQINDHDVNNDNAIDAVATGGGSNMPVHQDQWTTTLAKAAAHRSLSTSRSTRALWNVALRRPFKVGPCKAAPSLISLVLVSVSIVLVLVGSASFAASIPAVERSIAASAEALGAHGPGKDCRCVASCEGGWEDGRLLANNSVYHERLDQFFSDPTKAIFRPQLRPRVGGGDASCWQDTLSSFWLDDRLNGSTLASTGPGGWRWCYYKFRRANNYYTNAHYTNKSALSTHGIYVAETMYAEEDWALGDVEYRTPFRRNVSEGRCKELDNVGQQCNNTMWQAQA